MNKLKSSLHTTDKTDANSFEWSDLVRNPGRKAITIGAVLASLFPLCGCGTITSYAGEIFKAADSTIPSSTSMIVVGVAQFSGTLITTNLVERIGRRVILSFKYFSTSVANPSEKLFNNLKILEKSRFFSVFVHRVDSRNSPWPNHFGGIFVAKTMEI